jgi:hypothetical protein
MRSLKLETITGVVEFTDIIEYAFGFKYLFVHTTKNNTLSIDRSTIKEAFRKYKDKWVRINMKVNKKKLNEK